MESAPLRQSNQAPARTSNGTRVLFAPSFSINNYFIFHDLALLHSLGSLGAEVYYASGYTRTVSAYPIYGGRWNGDQTNGDLQLLRECEARVRTVFEPAASIVTMEQLVTSEELQRNFEMYGRTDPSDLAALTYRTVPVGKMALNVVRNMHMVNSPLLIPELGHELHRAVTDCVTYVDYFHRAIDLVKPNRIVSHDSFYYPWAIIEHLAKEMEIPFYSYYSGLRPDTYIYSYNHAAMNLSMEEIWESHREEALTSQQESQLQEHFAERKQGLVIMHRLVRDECDTEKSRILDFARQKPTAVLYGNVSWDLTALDKDLCFSSLADAYRQIVAYFSTNNDFQLIIKPHPDEEREDIPTTIERLSTVLGEQPIPANIMVLQPKAAVTAYDLFEVTKASLCHTSSAGVESILAGVPTVLFGKPHYRGRGFTIDPLGVGEFFGQVYNCLKGPRPDLKAQAELASRYWYHFMFTLNQDVGIPSYPSTVQLDHIDPKQAILNDRFRNIIEHINDGKPLPIP